MISYYSCRRKINRWPMVHFFTMIDVSALNALVLYNEINPTWCTKRKNKRRRIFIERLGLELANPFMMARKGCSTPHSNPSREYLFGVQSSSSSSSCESPLTTTSEEKTNASNLPKKPTKRGRCYVCTDESKAKSMKNDNMTQLVCIYCKRNACKYHTYDVCYSCYEKNSMN